MLAFESILHSSAGLASFQHLKYLSFLMIIKLLAFKLVTLAKVIRHSAFLVLFDFEFPFAFSCVSFSIFSASRISFLES